MGTVGRRYWCGEGVDTNIMGGDTDSLLEMFKKMGKEEKLELLYNNSLEEKEKLAILLNNEDEFFLIVIAIIIFFMQCGFAFLEAGSVRSKNTVNILIKNMLDAFIGGVSYWAIGWGLAYGAGGNLFVEDLSFSTSSFHTAFIQSGFSSLCLLPQLLQLSPALLLRGVSSSPTSPILLFLLGGCTPLCPTGPGTGRDGWHRLGITRTLLGLGWFISWVPAVLLLVAILWGLGGEDLTRGENLLTCLVTLYLWLVLEGSFLSLGSSPLMEDPRPRYPRRGMGMLWLWLLSTLFWGHQPVGWLFSLSTSFC